MFLTWHLTCSGEKKPNKTKQNKQTKKQQLQKKPHNPNQQHQTQGKIKNDHYLTKKFKCLTLLFSTAFQVPLAMAK